MWMILSLLSCSWGRDGPPPALLKDARLSGAHELVFLTSRESRIEYAPGRQVFVLETGLERLVLGRDGRERVRMPLDPAHHRFPGTPFVRTPEGIVDLGVTSLVAEPIGSVVDGVRGKQLREEVWAQRFAEAYAAADTVLYGEYDVEVGKVPVYLRTAGAWAVFYLRSGTDLVDIGSGIPAGRQLPDRPQRAPTLVMLGDRATGEVADVAYSVRNAPPTGETWAEVGTLTTDAWQKTAVNDTIVYTPIPVSHRGDAWYTLTVGADAVRFREVAVRPVGRALDTRLRWYTLPEAVAGEADVSFLSFRPQSNVDTHGSDGIYVIRPIAP